MADVFGLRKVKAWPTRAKNGAYSVSHGGSCSSVRGVAFDLTAEIWASDPYHDRLGNRFDVQRVSFMILVHRSQFGGS